MFKPSDYPMVCKWWESWGWPAIQLGDLPETGLIVSNGGVDIYAAFLYKTDSNICWFDWFVGNKEATKEQRAGGLEFLVEGGRALAETMGYKKLFSSVRAPSVMNALEKCGFSKEHSMTNFVGVV